jgi:hypothetical protein
MILVAPNNSIVKARIDNIKRNSKIYVELAIIESKDVEGFVNFTHKSVGTSIEVVFDETDASTLAVGKEVDGIYIKYVGDERGGIFYGKLKG